MTAIEEAKEKVVEVKGNRLVVFIMSHGEEVHVYIYTICSYVLLNCSFEKNVYESRTVFMSF